MTAGKQSLMGSSGANYRHHEISFFFFSFFLKKIKHFFYLVLQHLGAGLLCLLLVDELHEDSLVLEHVALGLQVELVVQVTVDLLGLPAECHNVKLGSCRVDKLFQTPNFWLPWQANKLTVTSFPVT